MKKIEFEIRKAGEGTDSYIELNKLLKANQVCESGAAANQLIVEGKVYLNGNLETRKRAKVRIGDLIMVENLEIRII